MALAHTILALLAQQPNSGYDLSKRFDEGLSCYWKASQQQVYRELSKMETQAWVRFETVPQTGKPDKKIFHITPEGWAELSRWYAEPTGPTQIREDLLVKVLIGHKMPMNLLVDELLNRQRIHQAQLDRYHDMQQNFQGLDEVPIEMQFKYMTLKRGIAYEESWLNWIAEVLEFVRSHHPESASPD
ncbi:MAG: PadR family transcriptional regulator [Cyanobacteria bacterium J06632_22]